MAANSLALEPDDAGPIPKLTLTDILSGDNLADILTDQELTTIGQKVIRDFKVDLDTLEHGTEDGQEEGWLDRYARWIRLAMQVRRNKTTPWPGASNIKYPLLTVASIQFQARAYPAIVDGSNLVKGRVLGPDPDGQKRERADRIGQHMTWQLLYKMVDWEEQTDKLLLMLPITGCVIRKTYYDPIAGANCSDMIPANDFIVNYWAKSLDSTPRVTQILHLYPYEAQERVAAGLWRKVRIDAQDGTDDDALVDFYEQHRMLDLDEDGIPEHYVVTTTTEGEVARVVPCFAMSDVFMRVGKAVKRATKLTDDELAMPDHPIVRVERQQYFTKYGFIPSPDGSFYDVGFGALLEDISAAVDSLQNQIVDAASLQNAGGGFIGAGVNIKSGNLRFGLAEWKRVDAGNGKIQDNIFPMPAAGPSTVSFQLLEFLIAAAQSITSSSDALTGGSPGTEQPTTLLARIEQAQKVMSGIFKRIHRAFGKELRILRRLNRDFLDEEEYFQLNDEDKLEEKGEPGETQGDAQAPQKIGKEDYQDEDLDVVPVSDPTIVSDVQKMAKAQAMMTEKGNPLVNQVELLRRYFDALGLPDIKTLLTVPEAPNPELLVKTMEMHIDKQGADDKSLQTRASAADQLADAAMKLGEAGLIQDAAAVAGVATEIATQGNTDGEPAAGPGDVPGMDGAPPDQGLPSAPPPEAAEPDGGMGAGPLDDAGGAGTGGLAGASSGPVA
jgi:chaperonin GroES